jgi:amino acid adenylation domain-containing protein
MLNSLKLYAKYFLETSFSTDRQFILHDLARFSMKNNVFREIKSYSGEERNQALDKAAGWLMAAQKANSDGGMGSYHLINLWSSSYPETTGYIIPTLLGYGINNNMPEAIESAMRAADFLLSIQKESGGWQGGRVHENRPEIVFNTGQVIRGLIVAYKHSGEKKYLDAAVKAGKWLSGIIHPEGFWKTNALMNRERVYDTFVDAPLLELYEVTGNELFKTTAISNLEWVINEKMKENGWFEDCDNTIKRNDRPILHTIAYTLDGLVDSGLLLKENKYIEAAKIGALKLRDIFLTRGFLNGRYDSSWIGSEYMICTGCAQMSIVWQKLSAITGDEKYAEAARKMLDLLIFIQDRKFPESTDTFGAISGSFPLWGLYEPFAFPNWATKFFCDALMMEEAKPHPLAPSPNGEGEEGAGGEGSEVCERVLRAAKTYPDRPALELHNAAYTYKELIEAAEVIANSINLLNDPYPFIAIIADKSFSCFAGILGILITGRAYLPINPRFPEARNQYMLEKAGVRTIIQDGIIKDLTPLPPLQMERGKRGQGVKGVRSSLAYLLFTSGTTGQPKGVPVSHGNLAAYLDFMLKAYDFSPEDRFTQIFDLTFDLSVHDMFLAWSTGACLCVPEDNSSFAMARFIHEKQPSVWFSVPSVVNLMDRMRLLKPGAFPSIRLSFFCGEALQVQTAGAWKKAAGNSKLVNLYGPTEATIAISRYKLPEEIGNWKMEIGILSIGKLFEGNSYLLNKEIGAAEPGELCLAGKQVVEGYFENEEADQQAFFIDPESGLKYYRTGDIVKADADGDLFYLGRKDSEVKISGYRVNLKEIENVIDGYENISQSVVIYDEGAILAFITDKDENAVEKYLDAYCRERLPWYMVPGKFIFVDEIPLNVNGKIDKAALLKKFYDGN